MSQGNTIADLRLDQLYYALVPSSQARHISGQTTPEENLAVILQAEAQIQNSVNNFRSRKNDADLQLHSIAEGLRKKRLLVDRGTQVCEGDVVNLFDFAKISNDMRDELQAYDVEFNQMFDMIPVEIDRLVKEMYGRLHTDAMAAVQAVQAKTNEKLDHLANFFDRQYEDAVASLLRWWKAYDDMLFANFQQDACLADPDTQAAVKSHKRQMAAYRSKIDRLNLQMHSLQHQLKNLGNKPDPEMDAEEQTESKEEIRLSRQLEEDIVQAIVDIEPLKKEMESLSDTFQTNDRLLYDKKKFLDALRHELNDLKKEHRAALEKTHAQLHEERLSLQEETDEHEKIIEKLENPVATSSAELEQQELLRQQIENSKKERLNHHQQLRLLQQELRGIDSMYDLRFQQLQKIGFMLRNETYIRRILERKFYKTANYLNIKEIMRMDGTDEAAKNDRDLYGMNVKGSGDQLETIQSAELGQSHATTNARAYEQLNITGWW